jgi:hypothetical protein
MALAEGIVELISASHEESRAYIDSLYADTQKSSDILREAYIDSILANVQNSINILKKGFTANEAKKNNSSTVSRFNRIVFTPLGSRVMLPHFGSRIHELIDRSMDFTWKIELKKYLYESFFNENLELWDIDFDPLEITLLDVDADQGSVNVSIKFKNSTEVSFNV